MNRSLLLGIAVILGVAATHCEALARGFGGGFGGFHGGGFSAGGFHGGGFSAGGFHEGGFSAGGSRGGGFEAGGYHAGGFNAGGYHAGGYHAGGFDAGGARAGGFEAGGARYGSTSRGRLNSFLGLPTDGGMHVAGSAGAAGRAYEGPMGTTVAHGAAGARGFAAGPEGAAADGRVVSGTAIRGPEGNVYTHSASAGRGFAAGREGTFAGGGAVAGRGYAGTYGTRFWSPTYCHSQGLAAQRWGYGRRFFTPGWCEAHPWGWCPAGYTAAAWASAVWAPVAWPTFGTWLAWNAAPAYYDYGNNITYQDNQVYYGSQPVATAQAYYQQAADLAASGATADVSQDPQWLPLGVFGLMADGQKTPDMVFQLAVNKQGIVRGNYYEQTSDGTLPVQGAVDKKNQRVAWRVSGNANLAVETGLYNLTIDESTALVHFGPDRTQQFVMVRLKKQ
jgi:hypothetical protein